MNKLYCVPLGSSARQFFINEIEQHGWDKALLVLPSGVLQKRAYAEGAVRVKNFDDIAGGLLNANGYTNLKRISRRTQELIVEELLKDYAAENQLPYFNVLVEKKGFVKAVTGLMGQLSRSGAKMEEIYEALNSWDRQGKLGLKDREAGLTLKACTALPFTFCSRSIRLYRGSICISASFTSLTACRWSFCAS